jgi:crossover junction endodeoxyribonuclease RuvC
MLIMGIDPGIAGAFAVIGPDGVEVDDLPVHQIGRRGTKVLRSELSLPALSAILQLHRPDHVLIEQVGPMPKQGVTSVFRFGFAFGAIAGAVAALELPCTFVPPKRWQRLHGIGPEPDAAIRRALQLYPALAPQLARKRDAHRADAVLIATFGQHMQRGLPPDQVAA